LKFFSLYKKKFYKINIDQYVIWFLYITLLYNLIITDFAFITHTHLELTVDFNEKVLEGKTTLDVERKPSATELVRKIIYLSKNINFYH